MSINQVIAFDVKGKIAHFRKYYSNSTALSYYLPPRTTIIGMIAGILGRERDSYYGCFSRENCHIAVSISTPVKKHFFRVNHLKVEKTNDLNGSASHTQVPYEVVMPEQLREEFVAYTIYFAHDNEAVFAELKGLFDSDTPDNVYPLSLGAANFTAFIDNVRVFKAKECKSDLPVAVSSAVGKEKIADFCFEEDSNKANYIISETLPLDFNSERKLIAHDEIIFSLSRHPVRFKLSSKYYELINKDQQLNIVFL